MAARKDIDVGVFAGSFTVLDFNREQYRIKGHPNNWDVSWLNSYSTIFALIAPRAAQWQLGRKDNFWPRPSEGVGTANRSWPGFARAPMADETWGQFLVLERIWRKFGARPDLRVHDGGHIVDYQAARAFVEATTFRRKANRP
jgi:hypothetical protein